MDNINTSLIVKWLRLPMALLVIFIHMTPHLNPHFTPVYSIDWQSLSPDNIYSIIGIFFNNLCTVAVPFFFFTAGYYFFFNTEKFDKDTYKSKIKKRIKTLLVPYVLWIIITIILRILYGLYKMYVLKLSISELPSDCLTIDEITTLSNILSFFWNYFIINENNTFNPLGLSSYLAAPINIPLWFLRDLIILTAISPLLYKGIKYLKKCLPDAEIIKTEINSEPAFVTQDIDMIYMGPMPENIQEVAIRKLRPYKEKIEELKNQLKLVNEKKEEITKLQNGKAGYVYVISNLGSFGDRVFKIGMTRRLNPIDRINELSGASVPFTFDVHSFIFSDDAVGLEQKIHEILNDNRVNKINLRKEFFKISIDELEKIVQDIDPSAEFNKTMIAEQYRQSLSIVN